MRLTSLFVTNRLHEWREDQYVGAGLVLHQFATDLIEYVDADIDALSNRVLATKQATYIARTVLPMIKERSRPLMDKLSAKANRDLEALAHEAAIWAESPTDEPRESYLEGMPDVALAAGPIAGGVATAMAIPAAAVTTTTGIFGFFATTTISWPIVASGGLVAGGLIATGLWNASRITDKMRARLRKKSREFILATVLIGKKHPSLLEQFARHLDAVVERARTAR
ncbi:hypothetical protein [Sphingomicrobium nitratireducens]|uniref:hypothetical protein n=1 Tax=Sphingomicrobium nitratireducens TaxID=2964666 RepID=UPI00223F9B0A|nr:hypothetical protein [Sphingomicrobium nitratireducens]